tara:strand:+ start:105 stop:383 length:279 start_codon:yes stop_codon:yes gene_type:complete
MEDAQFRHPLSKSCWNVVVLTGSEIAMLQEASASGGQVHFKTNVSADSVSFIVILYFVEPDVSRFNAVKEVLLKRTPLPPFGGDVDASLDPR